MRQNPWVRALDYLIESCWLLALVTVPIFFDTMTVRIFEPDKIVVFRNIVLVMAIALLVRVIAAAPAWMARPAAPSPSSNGDAATASAVTPWWRRLVMRWPMLIPVIIFTIVYTAATVHSVLPGISFWGSYDRSQGLYTWLSYIAFFAIMAYSLRSWSQIERIISALAFASLPVAAYGVMQHLHWDPVAWGAPTDQRVSSTLGNAIFLGAYLLMCLPFVAYRLWMAVERLRAPEPEPTPVAPRGGTRNRPRQKDVIEINGVPPIVPVIAYAVILIVDFAAMYFCGSRGPYYGLLVGTAVMGILLTLKLANPNPGILAIILAVIMYGVLYVENALNPIIALLILIVAAAGGIAAVAAPRLMATIAVPKLAIASVALVIAAIAFPQAVNVFSPDAVSSSADSSHLTDLGINGTSEVRTLIWRGSVPLIKHNPILGYGPETMIYVYSPYYLAELGHVEHANAAPDRNHDVWLDFLVFSGIIGLLSWLVLLASFAYVTLKALQRSRSRQASVVIAAIAAVVAGHLAEASVGIPIVSTLMILWTMFALAGAFYARGYLMGEQPVAQAAAAGAAEAAVPARELVGAGTGGRNRGRGGNGAQRPPRPPRGAQRPVPAPARPSFDRLNGRQQGGVVALIVLTLAATVGGIALFVNNVNVVRADAAYKLGQAYDNAGTACIAHAANPNDPNGAACPYQQATQQQTLTASGQFLQAALGYYQEANGEQPSQDMYDLWLGKTYLDMARYDQTVRNSAAVTTDFQNAEHALKTARALNPYNADHPMNLARMYHGWAGIDPSKWAPMDTYFAIATGLARHNGRWADEWGSADLDEAARRPGITAAQRTAIYRQALNAFQHASAVDDQLGDARALRARAYAALGMYTQAAASDAEALQIGNFEQGIVAQTADGDALRSVVVQELVMNLYHAHNYAGLAAPAYKLLAPAQQAGAAEILKQSPVTLAYSPTVQQFVSATPGFTQTLQSISDTLRSKGLIK